MRSIHSLIAALKQSNNDLFQSIFRHKVYVLLKESGEILSEEKMIISSLRVNMLVIILDDIWRLFNNVILVA